MPNPAQIMVPSGRFLLATAVLLGCSNNGGKPALSDGGLNDGAIADEATGVHVGSVSEGGPTPAVLPTLSQLADGWNELHPGGATTCCRGTEFFFYVRPGSVNRVVVEFIGGGACWDAATCAPNSGLFYDSAELTQVAIRGGNLPGFGIPLDGIYNRTRADNPFKDWYHVVIPYCTGDLHWGNASQDYGSLHIEHRGAVNARAVLDWLYKNFAAPEMIFATGCSAGALGSVVWSAELMRHYTNTRVIQFGDSEAGITTPSYSNELLLWNATAAFPSWIPSLDMTIENLSVPNLYIAIANSFPTNFMSQYDTVFDSAQPIYYRLGGGDVQTWSAQMLTSLDTIEAGARNFASFVPPGTTHCVLFRENLYTVNVNGTKLIDWLGQLLSTGSETSTRCTSDCTNPTP